MPSLLKGATLAVLTIIVASFMPEPQRFTLFALLLTFAAGVYIGFATIDQKNQNEYWPQVIFSVMIVMLALVGIWIMPLLIGFGWLLHGAWDTLHHLRKFKTETGRTYPLLCLSYDFVLAGYIFYSVVSRT